MKRNTIVRAHKRRKPGGGYATVGQYTRRVPGKNQSPLQKEAPPHISWPARGDVMEDGYVVDDIYYNKDHAENRKKILERGPASAYYDYIVREVKYWHQTFHVVASKRNSIPTTWMMTEDEYLNQEGFSESEVDRARKTGRQSQNLGKARLKYYKEIDAAIKREDPVPKKVAAGGFIYKNPSKKQDVTHNLIGYREGIAQIPIHYKYDKKGRKKAYRYSRMQMRWFPISVKEADLQVMIGKSYITPTMEGVY